MKMNSESASFDSGEANPVSQAAAQGRRAPSLIQIRTIRRTELHQIVPLSDTTIYEMEQRGDFPRRFHLTSRCVVWDLSEVEAWIKSRRRASEAASVHRAPIPDVHRRRSRPVKQ
jgi:Predicted transcriptional regulator